MIRIKSIQEHLNRWMLAYVSLAIVAGLVLGNAAAGWTKANTGPIGLVTTAAVFLIIYPCRRGGAPAIPGVSGVHDLHVWALPEDLPIVTAHLEVAPDANAGRALVAGTEALRRIGVGHATLQIEQEPCGQGRPATRAAVPTNSRPAPIEIHQEST